MSRLDYSVNQIHELESMQVEQREARPIWKLWFDHSKWTIGGRSSALSLLAMVL